MKLNFYSDSLYEEISPKKKHREKSLLNLRVGLSFAQCNEWFFLIAK